MPPEEMREARWRRLEQKAERPGNGGHLASEPGRALVTAGNKEHQDGRTNRMPVGTVVYPRIMADEQRIWRISDRQNFLAEMMKYHPERSPSKRWSLIGVTN
jgi:hypothetical protein